jgi:hypothetical protein
METPTTEESALAIEELSFLSTPLYKVLWVFPK